MINEVVQIRATKNQIEEFKLSLLWQDIVSELESWIYGFNSEMSSIVDDAAENNPTSATVLMHIGDINGRRKATERFIGLLDDFLNILDIKEKDLPVLDDEDN